MPRDMVQSVTIAGCKTSISLEPEFYDALAAIAALSGCPLKELISRIDRERSKRPGRHANLTSACRLYVLKYLTEQLAAVSFVGTMVQPQAVTQ